MSEILKLISLISDLAIIFLLAIQSYVLWKLKDPIMDTAKNSEIYKKMFSKVENAFKKPDKKYPQYLIDSGLMNCDDWQNPSHVHIKDCY